MDRSVLCMNNDHGIGLFMVIKPIFSAASTYVERQVVDLARSEGTVQPPQV